MAQLELVAMIVKEYDPAIRLFVNVLGFELIEDSPSLTNDGRPKRWVVVRPVAATPAFCWLARMVAAGVTFVGAPRTEAYGKVVVFLDLEGNRWDLLGPHNANSAPTG